MIKFSDGMTFDTTGPLRLTCRSDGWYVVGEGMLCPVDNIEAGQKLIQDLNDRSNKN